MEWTIRIMDWYHRTMQYAALRVMPMEGMGLDLRTKCMDNYQAIRAKPMERAMLMDMWYSYDPTGQAYTSYILLGIPMSMPVSC